ncbi:hypothetical protein B0T16DRAFT_323103, partial [Cercophora newfieldiana]
LGQRFGREWIFGLNGVNDQGILPIIVLQFCRDEDLTDNKHDSGRPRFTKRFLTYFTGPWGQDRHHWITADERWSGMTRLGKPHKEDKLFQFHMRVFTAQGKGGWFHQTGPGLMRDRGTLAVPGKKTNLDLCEIRFSVGLKTTWEMDLPIFTLVTMADLSVTGYLKVLEGIGDNSKWAAANIRPSTNTTGVAAFAFRIRSLLPVWEAHWLELLQGIDAALQTDVILRLAADWIQESMDDLRRTVDYIDQLCCVSDMKQFAIVDMTSDSASNNSQDSTLETFRQNWDSVESLQRQIGNGLLARIAKRQAEVKNLQDSLFNATAVSEATKSTQLNHYILVFTAVTVIYLPLTFVTVCLALHTSVFHHRPEVTPYADHWNTGSLLL